MYMLFRLGAVAFLLILISACSNKKEAPAFGGRPQSAIMANAFVVSPSSLSDKIEVSGSLLPFEETQLRAEVGGRIVQLNIQEGQVVEKGALMVKLFDNDLQAQLKKLQVQLKIKEKNAERNAELLAINGISQQDYDLAILDVENLRADIEAVEIAISKTELRAPYRGRVGLRNVSLGSYVSPSDIITTIRQVDQLKLEFSVPEKYAKEIGKGYAVRFTVDGGRKQHRAKVMATESSVDQNTRTLRVRASVIDKDPELVPGVFAKISLQLSLDENALLIPTQAIVPTARNKQVILYRNDSIIYTVVETGLRDSVYVQVTHGLQPGDTIISSALMAIRPNSKVRINQVSSIKN
jgi:membrane fusion protein (multidrug efflux system)